MDALSTDLSTSDYSARPPVLVTTDSEDAYATASRVIAASGLRVSERIGLPQALARIDRQAAASALWIELDSSRNAQVDALLDRVNRDAASGRYAAVVSAPGDIIDAIAARVAEPGVEILIDANDADRASALAVAIANHRRSSRLSDVAADKNAARLRHLSEEVSRIASTLARLSTGPATPPPRIEAAPQADAPPVAAETVRSVIRARRLRNRYFPDDLFADPAWDMLLDLLQAEIAQLRVPVSSLCIAAAVPATTALRWLKTMVQQGIFIRRADPHDGRRVFVELAPETSHALRRYFAEVQNVSVI